MTADVPRPMSDCTDLVRSLCLVAADLEDKQYPLAPVLRVAARALAQSRPPEPDGCARCGAVVTQPATGRPRLYCLDCSPRKTPRKRNAGT